MYAGERFGSNVIEPCTYLNVGRKLMSASLKPMNDLESSMSEMSWSAVRIVL